MQPLLVVGMVILALFLLLQMVLPGSWSRAVKAEESAVAPAPPGDSPVLASARDLVAAGQVRQALELLETARGTLPQDPLEAFCQIGNDKRKEVEVAGFLASRLEKEHWPPESLAAAAAYVGEYVNGARALRALDRGLQADPGSPHLNAALAQVLAQIASEEADDAGREASLPRTRAAAERVNALTEDQKLRARASWSLAVHLAMAGHEDEAKDLFASIVGGGCLGRSHQAEVAWQAALLAMKGDRSEDAARYVDVVLDSYNGFRPGEVEALVPYADLAVACRYAMYGTPIPTERVERLAQLRAELLERGFEQPLVWQRFAELPTLIAGLEGATPQQLEGVLAQMDRSERAWEKYGTYLRCPWYQHEGQKMTRVVASVIRGDALMRLGRAQEASAEYRSALQLAPGSPAIQQRLQEVASAT